MNSQHIFPDLSGLFLDYQQVQNFTHGPSDASRQINGPGLYNAAPTQATSEQPGDLHLPDPTPSLVSTLHDAASISDAELTATPTSPHPKGRKKKAPTLRDKDWEPYKARILELHDEQKLPLPKVKTMIEEEFSFTAELRQYRTRITQWGKDKNVKPREMSAIVRKRQQRKLVEVDKREQTFIVRGRNVEPHKIDRWMVRNEVSKTSLYAPSPAASTPSAVDCRTISERDSVVSSPAYSITSLNFSPREPTLTISSPVARSPMPSAWGIPHPHATTFIGQGPALINQSPATHPLISHSAISNSVSDEQLSRRYLQDDEERIREELSTAADSLGISHHQTLKLRIDLGHVLMSQGRYKSAEEIARRAMEDCQRRGVVMIDATELLSNILYKQGSLLQARKLAESVIESSKAILGDDHPSTLTSMESLSLQYLESGELEQAEQLCARTVNKIKRAFGERHPRTMRGMSVLAFVYSEQGQLDEAEKLAVEVLKIRKGAYGEMHQDTISIMAQVASIYYLQTRYKDAEALQVQTVEISILLLGEEHPDTLYYYQNLAITYREQGRLQQAADLGLRVLLARRRVLGEQHPKTLTSTRFLIRIYTKQEREREAEDLGLHMLTEMKRTLGEQDDEISKKADFYRHTLASRGFSMD